jgi:hypothetical protein
MGFGRLAAKSFVARNAAEQEAKRIYEHGGQAPLSGEVAPWEPSLLEPAVGAALGWYIGGIPGGDEEEVLGRKLRYALYGGALGGIGALALGAVSAKKANHTPRIQALMAELRTLTKPS